MCAFVYVCLSVCLSVCQPACLCCLLSVCLSVCVCATVVHLPILSPSALLCKSRRAFNLPQGAADPADPAPPFPSAQIYNPDPPKFYWSNPNPGPETLQIFGEPFHEYEHSEEGEAVMGKEYVDTPFDATINSVPEPNPSREWEVLDVQNEPNPNY